MKVLLIVRKAHMHELTFNEEVHTSKHLDNKEARKQQGDLNPKMVVDINCKPVLKICWGGREWKRERFQWEVPLPHSTLHPQLFGFRPRMIPLSIHLTLHSEKIVPPRRLENYVQMQVRMTGQLFFWAFGVSSKSWRENRKKLFYLLCFWQFNC